MRLLCDMGIAVATATALRDLGHDAVHLVDLGLSRAADREILDLARAEKRVVVAHDLDFTDLVAVSGASTPSVVIFRLRVMRPERVLARLVAVIEALATDLDAGAIVTITEALTRVRRLPVSPDLGAHG
jgi:predicted nuclease of predicted toxin-antitoxin system